MKDFKVDYFVTVLKDTTFDPGVVTSFNIPSLDISKKPILTSMGRIISISPQQAKILEYIISGVPVKCIADILSISENAVRKSLKAIEIKTGLWSTNEIISAFYKANQET
jgi:DNA-binding CsgD family transcriptional regulator